VLTRRDDSTRRPQSADSEKAQIRCLRATWLCFYVRLAAHDTTLRPYVATSGAGQSLLAKSQKNSKKWRECRERATYTLISARALRNNYITSCGCKAAHFCSSAKHGRSKMSHLTFDVLFSVSCGIVQTRKWCGFDAQCMRAPHEGYFRGKTIPCVRLTAQTRKTRKIRGQRGLWLCFRGRQTAPTRRRDRGCKWNCSGGPFRPSRRDIRNIARVEFASQARYDLGRRSLLRARHMPTTQTPIELPF
jgi:hypothetical protein